MMQLLRKKLMIAIGGALIVLSAIILHFSSRSAKVRFERVPLKYSESIGAEDLFAYNKLLENAPKGVETKKLRSGQYLPVKHRTQREPLEAEASPQQIELPKEEQDKPHESTILHIVSKQAPVHKPSLTQPEADIVVPYGRMLKCELVNTVDSINHETPLLGLLMEPLWANGAMIFPAGTEVHGKATTDKVHARICSNRNWVIVPQLNKTNWTTDEIHIQGVALDREDLTGEGKTYGITDGSYGIRGHRLQTTEMDELKIFAASFLEAAAAGLQTTEPVGGDYPNSKVSATPRNAALAGTANVLNEYVEILRKEIQEKGFYTRVPAGKQFYIYIQQSLHIEEDNGLFTLVDASHKLVNKAAKQGVNQLKATVHIQEDPDDEQA